MLKSQFTRAKTDLFIKNGFNLLIFNYLRYVNIDCNKSFLSDYSMNLIVMYQQRV